MCGTPHGSHRTSTGSWRPDSRTSPSTWGSPARARSRSASVSSLTRSPPGPLGRASLREPLHTARLRCFPDLHPGRVRLTMADDLAFLDATAQAELVRNGEASPKELVEAAIERIERVNAELNAVIHPLFDKARDVASSPDLPDGPFRGVPLVLKDLICHTAGDPFHEGMRLLKDLGWTEREDTYLAAKFRAAGFVFVGKTNTPELGILPTAEPEAYGATRNPWNTGHSTGGSSGGSAAAVASGMVPVAHANDGGGSIRVPASECGLVGLKPTRGRTSLGPEFGDVQAGLVAEHVLTRSVRDSAAVLDVVAGPMPGDLFIAPPLRRPFGPKGASLGRQ